MFTVGLALCALIIFVGSAADLPVCHIDTDELNDMGVRKKNVMSARDLASDAQCTSPQRGFLP